MTIGKFDPQEAEAIESASGNGLETKANIPLVEEVRQESIQSRFKDDELGEAGVGGISSILERQIAYFFQSSDTLPPWWSPTRDQALSEFWKTVNLLSGAMYAMVSKMTTIPFHIEPCDTAITSHYKIADTFERRLKESADGGVGWGQFYSKQIQSLLGQDNGRFMEIIDSSPNKAGPIMGPALSVAHLDPSRCMRTSDPVYPVVYTNEDGTRRKLHWTRVAFEAQLPSERVSMLGIGVCAVSRSSSYGRNLLDMTQYKEEKLGSRPTRGIMLAGGGLDPKAVGMALEVVAGQSDNRGLKRFSLMPIVGDAEIEEPSLELISLSTLPDGFNEETGTDIAMAAIALAFGVDARELWPGQQRGTTRADAILSHIKQRGKGPGQIIAETERMFDNWFLPKFLKMVFDFQDDAQDRQRAEINRERSLARKNDMTLGVTDSRVERERMVYDGSISADQFKNLELGDGRLPDGLPLGTLFYRKEETYAHILTLPNISNPVNIRANDPEKVLNAISSQLAIAQEILANESRQIQTRQAREAIAALEWLQSEYESALAKTQIEQTQEQQDVQSPTVPASTNRQGDRETATQNSEGEQAIGARPNDENSMAQDNFLREKKEQEEEFSWFNKEINPQQLVFDTFKDVFGKHEQVEQVDDMEEEVYEIKRDGFGEITELVKNKQVYIIERNNAGDISRLTLKKGK
jgi:hypothetical protein